MPSFGTEKPADFFHSDQSQTTTIYDIKEMIQSGEWWVMPLFGLIDVFVARRVFDQYYDAPDRISDHIFVATDAVPSFQNLHIFLAKRQIMPPRQFAEIMFELCPITGMDIQEYSDLLNMTTIIVNAEDGEELTVKQDTERFIDWIEAP